MRFLLPKRAYFEFKSRKKPKTYYYATRCTDVLLSYNAPASDSDGRPPRPSTAGSLRLGGRASKNRSVSPRIHTCGRPTADRASRQTGGRADGRRSLSTSRPAAVEVDFSQSVINYAPTLLLRLLPFLRCRSEVSEPKFQGFASSLRTSINGSLADDGPVKKSSSSTIIVAVWTSFFLPLPLSLSLSLSSLSP